MRRALALALLAGGLVACGTAVTGADCDDGNPCTYDRASRASQACTHEPQSGTCDDHSVCTTDDHCADGACIGIPLQDDTVCGGSTECVEQSVCIQGTCTGIPRPDGTSCDDGNACTRADVCEVGQCAGTPAASMATLVGDAPAFGGRAVYEPDGALLFFTQQTQGTRITRARRIGDALVPEASWRLDGLVLVGSDVALGAVPPLRGDGGVFVSLANRQNVDPYALTGGAVVFRLQPDGEVAHSPLLGEHRRCGGEWFGPPTAVERFGSALYVASFKSVCVYDLTRPVAPQQVARVTFDGCSVPIGTFSASTAVRTGRTLWLPSDFSVCLLDLESPENPVVSGQLDLAAWQILPSEDGTRAYVLERAVAGKAPNVRLYDVTGRAPRLLARSEDLPGLSGAMRLAATSLVVTDGDLPIPGVEHFVRLLDLDDLGTRSTLAGLTAGAVQGETVVARAGDEDVWLDVSDPDAPVTVATTVDPRRKPVATDGDTFVARDGLDTRVMGLDPGPPARLTPLDQPALGRVGYLSSGPAGIWAVDVASTRLVDISRLEAPAFVRSSLRVDDVTVYALDDEPGLPWVLPPNRSLVPARWITSPVLLSSLADPTRRWTFEVPLPQSEYARSWPAVVAGDHIVAGELRMHRLAVLSASAGGLTLAAEVPIGSTDPKYRDGVLLADATGRWVGAALREDGSEENEVELWDLETPSAPVLLGSRRADGPITAFPAKGRVAVLSTPRRPPGLEAHLRVWSPDGEGGLGSGPVDVTLPVAIALLGFDGRMAVVSVPEGLAFVDLATGKVWKLALPSAPTSFVTKGDHLILSTDTDVAVVTPACPIP